jgi:hypothetical protein
MSKNNTAEYVRKGIKILFTLSILYGTLFQGVWYTIGLVSGMMLMSILILFPSSIGYMVLRKLFPEGFEQFKQVQNEHETQESKFKVKY